MTVVVSEEPRPEADAWVALRTREADKAPAAARTVVCIHDLFDEPGMYAPDGERRGVHRAGGIVLCHPLQRPLLEEAGVRLDRAAVLERPIGALTSFDPADRPNARFTIGCGGGGGADLPEENVSSTGSSRRWRASGGAGPVSTPC